MSAAAHATAAEPNGKGQPEPCTHLQDIPASLSSQFAADVTTCPLCTIRSHIASVKITQEGFNTRGGIFVSRPKTKKDFNHPEWKAHLGLREKWRTTKIALLNDVMKFENLSTKEHQGEGWGVVDEALALWEKEAENLATMPGYVKEMSESEVGDIVKRMMSQLNQQLGIPSADVGMTDSAEEEEEATACPFPDSDIDTDPEDEDMSDPGLAPSDDSSINEELESEDEALSPEASHEDVDSVMAGGEDTAAAKEGRRRVRFTDFATVSPDSLVYVPSLFPQIFNIPDFDHDRNALPLNVSTALLSQNTTLSSTPFLRPHRKRVDVSNKRRKRTFSRSRDGYRRGIWASPRGYEKPDTSEYYVEWRNVDAKRADAEAEEAEEKRIFGNLKAVAGTWVLGRVLRPAIWSYNEGLKRISEEHLRRESSEDSSAF